ncbi:hypothetical protein B0H13DRAFT_2299578 [Mycena leptocephala]|nr:hypothetical protein B0H13DRAFT_2299578 [Mycena leptocephala]
MRMEVVICTPADLKSKRAPEPVEKVESDALPKKLKRKRVDDETAPPRNTKTRKSLESDLKDQAPPHRKPRLKKKTQYPAPSDETCSGDEVESERIIESRLRSREKLSGKNFALEQLRRKRKGLEPQPEPEPSEDSDDSESEHDSLFDGSESDDSSDFIVEDDGSAVAALPKEFSMDAHAGLSHQFKIIFQFMVHLAVHPQVERAKFMEETLKTQEYFSTAFKVAQRRISSLGSSLVASNRWKPALVTLLKTYPTLEIKDLPSKRFTPICDACRIKGRRGCRTGEFSGTPYNRLGFADVTKSAEDEHSDMDESSDSDENLDSDASESSDKKDSSGPQVKIALGRFCSERIQVFHQISHWEYDLFKCILAEVDQLYEVKQSSGVINLSDVFVPVKYADGKRPEDLHDADAINDWLVRRNFVGMEWEKIKLLIERARKVENQTD